MIYPRKKWQRMSAPFICGLHFFCCWFLPGSHASAWDLLYGMHSHAGAWERKWQF